MAEIGLPLCVHGEVTDDDVDIFDREAVFIERVLDPLRRATPGLRVVMEHITTADGVEYAQSVDERSEEHTSELQSPVPISYAVFCLKKKNTAVHAHAS